MGCGGSTDIPVIGKDQIVQSAPADSTPYLICDDGLSNPLELHISCQDLVNLDFSTKTDPFAIVYVKNSPTEPWTEVGRTEQIKDSLNPTFVKQITMKYMFEVRQLLKIEIWDCDDPNTNELKSQELVGTCETTVADLVREKTKTMPLSHPKRSKSGTIKIFADHVKQRYSSNLVKMQISAEGVPRSGSIFFKIYRTQEAGGAIAEEIPVYQSEPVVPDNNEKIQWAMVKIGAAALMRDNQALPLKIEIFEYRSSGNHITIEKQAFNFNQIIDNSFCFKGGCGTVRIQRVELVKRVSFMDFIMNGANIMLGIAIDFTASNQPITNSNSLHTLNLADNQYFGAIRAVGGILQMYDTDKRIPVYGFGCIMPHIDTEVHHCFALNGNIFSPEVYTVNGVEELYMKNVAKLGFAGPTYFAPIINYVGDMAQFYVTNGMYQNYIVLLILTDGAICDFDETVDAIIRCSTLPMSIVIVGVGDSCFDSMDALDSDKGKLYSKNTKQYASRDIVQFVPYTKYASNPSELARVTLAEIPGQFAEYMSRARIDPGMLRALPPNPTTFYEARMASFLAHLEAQGYPKENAVGLANAGFPTENMQAFAQQLQKKYVNYLAMTQ